MAVVMMMTISPGRRALCLPVPASTSHEWPSVLLCQVSAQVLCCGCKHVLDGLSMCCHNDLKYDGSNLVQLQYGQQCMHADVVYRATEASQAMQRLCTWMMSS